MTGAASSSRGGAPVGGGALPRITLLTDFGTADGYVAAMKGVLASRVPDALLDDVAHDLPRGDVRAGSWALRRFWRRFPGGTVHLVVVDPGVGTERRALAVEAEGRFVVCPDNGVATSVLEEAADWRAVELVGVDPPEGAVSTTFHGRDLFAPAAARLATGTPLDELGPDVADPIRLDEPQAEMVDGGVRGQVVHVDRFGNLVRSGRVGGLGDLRGGGRTDASGPRHLRRGRARGAPGARQFGRAPGGGGKRRRPRSSASAREAR